MRIDLTGRAVLVTGGATGIGAAISRYLCDAGARVAVVQSSPQSLAAGLESSGLGGRVVGFAADLAQADQCRSVVRDAHEALGGLTDLVNNAAVTGPPVHRGVLDYDDDYVDHVVDVNLKGVVRCTTHALRHMVDAGGGTVVSIASVLAHLPAPGGALYSATKAALLGLTRGIALELGDHGIRAVTVSPGDIATSSSVAPPVPEGRRPARIPALGRRGEPADIGAIVAFLLSDEARYITGTDVLVDGGFLLG